MIFTGLIIRPMMDLTPNLLMNCKPPAMITRKITPEAAQDLAVAILARLARDDERMSRFLALTGIDGGDIRAAAQDPGFLAGVMDYVAGDETLLLDIAKELDTKPERLMEARWTLSPSEFE
jgi:hypothetical protein